MTHRKRENQPFMTKFFPPLILVCLLAPQVSAADEKKPASQTKPNIVLITADNLGYGDVGCYGNRQIKTPVIDRLATQGVRCTDYYTASPTCTVSRATLLTGRYPQRIKLNKQLGAAENLGIGLRQSEQLLPQYLKPLGYTTGCFGKWNIGFAPGSRPTERGFDEFFGHASGNIDYDTHRYAGRNDLFRGTEAVTVDGYSTDLFSDAACDFIRRHAKSPFFVYLPFNAPHFPSARNKQPGKPNIWQAPAAAFEAYGYAPDESDPKKRYQAVVTALDTGIGRVLAQLDLLNLSRRTLVIFYSDNGAFMLPERGLEVASNRPLRDGGVTLWEGGLRVPCIVRWPGVIKSGTLCREPWISLDLLPLILQVAGGELPQSRILDGRNPLPLLLGKTPEKQRSLFFAFRHMQAVRRGNFKLIRSRKDSPLELYDLEKDLGERQNISDQHPQITAKLAKELADWVSQF